MIPRCYPTNTSGAMIVGEVLPTGLVKWVDYIPVQLGSAGEENTYNDAGEKVIETLADLTGLVPWVDYIPIVTDVGQVLWRSDDDGAIPVIEEV